MNETQKELFSLVHLNRHPGVGPGKTMQLRNRFGSAAAVVEAFSELRSDEQTRLTGLEIERAKQAGIHILGIHEHDYPESLRRIESPPPVLYALGRRELLTPGRDFVAIVGSRTPTAYGRSQAAHFAAALSRTGSVIVSGLARGIDETAHRTVIEEEGDTIAVLGSGLLSIYPNDDARFVSAMREKALLLSEFPLDSGPLKGHFPWRNRILSGLSRAVLVVEAAEKSGSLHTAYWAIDQGKELWAIPGRIDNPMSRGVHLLLRQGCDLALHPNDLLPKTAAAAPTEGTRQNGTPSALFHLFDKGAKTVDELCEETGRSPESIMPELLEWEILGLICRGPGGLYRKVE